MNVGDPKHPSAPRSATSEVPEHGARFELVRGEPHAATGEIVYRGHAHTNGASYALVVRVTPEAATAALSGEGDLSADAIEKLEKSASALVRAATRTLLAEGRPTPRKIVRWRT